jgi:hypothetical protein
LTRATARTAKKNPAAPHIGRDEPVYDDWCTFTGRRWEYDRSVSTSGTDNKTEPFWGDVSMNCAGQRSIGCEREAGRNETYNVLFKADKDNIYKCPFPQAEWQTIKIESVWTLDVYAATNAPDCSTVKQK